MDKKNIHKFRLKNLLDLCICDIKVPKCVLPHMCMLVCTFVVCIDQRHVISPWCPSYICHMRTVLLRDICLILCMLSNFHDFCCCRQLTFSKLTFKKFFQEHYQCVWEFGSRSGPMSCHSWFGSKLSPRLSADNKMLGLIWIQIVWRFDGIP